MSDSANLSAVERRKQQTRLSLTRHARRLTIERGLSGFTVAEVCELAGVSRRTFFNYFATKEDAVIGGPPVHFEQSMIERHVTRPRRDSRHLSPTMLEDLIHLTAHGLEHSAALDDIDTIDDPRPVIAREPHLMLRFMGAGEEARHEFIVMLAAHCGRTADDVELGVVLDVALTLVRVSAERYFTPGNTLPFTDLLYSSLRALQGAYEAAPTQEGSSA